LGRFWLSTAVYAVLGRGFPYGTLFVNVVGSLAMGFLFVFMTERTGTDAVWRAAVLVGGLGAFTTFSTFSMETLALVESGEHLRAGLNVLGSVVLCLAACWVGLVLGRHL
jgi:CrcB protein